MRATATPGTHTRTGRYTPGVSILAPATPTVVGHALVVWCTPTITPNHPPCSLSRGMDPKGPRMERIVRVRWGVGSGTHNPLAGMPREAVDGASRIRPWNTPQRDRITRRNLVDRFPSPGGGSNLIGAHCARSRSMPAVGAGGSDQRQQGGNEHASKSKIGYLPKNCFI